MTSRIVSVCLGILVFSITAWSQVCAQGIQVIPITPPGSPQSTQSMPPQNQGYAPYTQQGSTPQMQPSPTVQPTVQPPGMGGQVPPYQGAPYQTPQYQGQTLSTQPGAYPPTTPPPSGVQPPQPQTQQYNLPPAPSALSQQNQFVTQSLEPPSAFEQYVSGLIPTDISFDIKQFGYDLFYKAPSIIVPTPKTGVQQTQPTPPQLLPGQIAPPQPVPGQTSPYPSPTGQPLQTQSGMGQPLPGQTSGSLPSTRPLLPGQGLPTQGFPGQGMPQPMPGQGGQLGAPQGAYNQGQLAQGMLNQGVLNPMLQTQLSTAQTAPGQGGSFQGLPSQDVPVGPGYVLGPGDDIRVTLWGSVEGSWDTVVDRDGNISLPKAGVLGVTGLTFEEMKEVVKKEFSKYYTDFEINISMGPLKTIRVYIVGNARAPGTYSVSSLSTIINALVAAGGPSKSGTMRDIQLKRNGQTVAHLDLYDFLIRGDKTKDARLMPEDVIFIPSIGPIVGVAGNVARPAIYELKSKTRLTEMLKLAGGTTAASYLQRVQVERVQQREGKVLLDQNLQKVRGKEDIFVEDGDIVKIFPISSLVTNKIILQGNVKRPGEYEWKQGMRVGDILQSVDNLLPNTLLDYAVIERNPPPTYHQEYTTFSLEGLLLRHSDKDNILLQPFDVITIYSKPEIRQKEIVRISGAVNKPGEFEYRDNMKVSDLVKLAGGLRRYAFVRTAELTRVTPTQEGPRTERITVSLGAAMDGDTDLDIPLREDDYLLIKSVPDWQLYRKVFLAGEVKFPGEYALKKGETLSSLIERAGGYTDKAYLRGAYFVRLSVKEVQQNQLNEMINRLERELNAMGTSQVSSVISADDAKAIAYQQNQKRMLIEGLRRIEAKGRMVVHLDQPPKLRNTPYDITMEESDYLSIPSNPQTVQVIGAVYNSSSFVFEPKRDYSYYIQKAGGYSSTADKGEVYVLKVDGGSMKPNRSHLFWSSEAHQWASGYSGMVEPGDTVVVPDRLEIWPWLPRVKDFTTVLYQIAVGAGVLFKAF